MTKENSVKRADGIPFQKIDGNILIVNPKNREVHLLNDTATFIWESIEKQRVINDLAVDLCESYELTQEQAVDELKDFFNNMKNKGLVELG